MSAQDQFYTSEFIGDVSPYLLDNWIVALNDHGHALYHRPAWVETYDAYPVWTDGTNSFDLVDPNWQKVRAMALNNEGLIVGYAVDWENISWAAFWNGVEWEALEDAPENSVARSVNDDGLIVGHYHDGVAARAFFFDDEGFHDIGASIETQVFATVAINSAGTVLLSWYDSGYHSAIWIDSDLRDLSGFPESDDVYAVAINSSNQVLCNYDNDVFVWYDNDGNDAIIQWSELHEDFRAWGYDLNDAGEILVLATPIAGGAAAKLCLWTVDGESSTLADVRIPGVRYPNRAPRLNNAGQILIEGDYHGPYVATYSSLFLATAAAPPGMGTDQTPPDFGEIGVSFPEFGPPYPLFSVQVTDSGGIDWSSVRVYIDGILVPSGHSGDEILCNFDHELATGSHHIDFFVRDNAGNEAWIGGSLTIGDADETPPIIDQKVPQGVIATSTPVISARITDEESWVQWWHFGSQIYGMLTPPAPPPPAAPPEFPPLVGIPEITYGPQGRVFFECPYLEDGEYSIEFYVADNAGNLGYASWTFIVDTAITVSSMSPTAWISDSTPVVQATIESTGFLPLVGGSDLPVYLNYEQVDVNSISYDDETHLMTFTAQELADGPHVVSVAGVDWTFKSMRVLRNLAS